VVAPVPSDPIAEALFKVIRRLSAEAAYESLYGEEIPESREAEMLERPIAFDPRFDLDPVTPLVIDDVSRSLRETGIPVDLRSEVLRQGLADTLTQAETVGDYLSVLRSALKGGAP